MFRLSISDLILNELTTVFIFVLNRMLLQQYIFSNVSANPFFYSNHAFESNYFIEKKFVGDGIPQSYDINSQACNHITEVFTPQCYDLQIIISSEWEDEVNIFSK
jgi:hypothetical protein